MQSSPSGVAIGLFFGVIAITLAITYWAARRSNSAAQLYAAGGSITAGQNGLAIAGDLLSAALFLGGIGMYFTSGYDAILYFFPAMAGFALMLGFIAGPLRRLGKYTFADVACARLNPVPIRILAAFSSLAVTLMYMIIQMVGAGGLIQILFGIPYTYAVIIVGSLMVIYVAFGGMLATTWVQIIKAILMLSGLAVMSILALAHVGWNLDELYSRAASVHKLGEGLFQPGGLNLSVAQAASLSLAIALGIPGMPHILMRFFTVPNPNTARKSLVIGMVFIGLAYTMVFLVLGAAGTAFITGNPDFVDAAGKPHGGTNMVALHLASFLGGNVLFGAVAAVAFATILAVVSGLTVAAASALSHDIYVGVLAKGKKINEKTETTVFRVSCLVIGGLSILLGIAFEGQNIIYLTGMLYSIAASACFPVLVMSMYWRRLTTQGALAGGYAGLVSSLILITIGPSVWVAVLKNATPILPIEQPAIISVPVAFITMILVSLMTQEAQRPATAAAE
ncbi:MAG: cation acetate symporter [Rhodospirillaceae bacterium]|nr:cation acetate symporter [Rhodospirillaceae bacterium]